MKLTRADLQLMEHIARTEFINTPNGIELCDTNEVLSSSDIRYLSMLRAAIAVLNRHSCLNGDVVVQIQDLQVEVIED